MNNQKTVEELLLLMPGINLRQIWARDMILERKHYKEGDEIKPVGWNGWNREMVVRKVTHSHHKKWAAIICQSTSGRIDWATSKYLNKHYGDTPLEALMNLYNSLKEKGELE